MPSDAIDPEARLARIREQEEQIARLRRMGAETDKFIAEQHKLIAEASIYQRDRTTAILSAGAAILAAGAALGGIAIKLLGG